MIYKILKHKKVEIYYCVGTNILLSIFSYFGFKDKFWIPEMLPFVFLLIVTSTFFFTFKFRVDSILHYGYIDIAFISYFLYFILRNFNASEGFPEKIFFLLALLILYFVCRKWCHVNKKKFFDTFLISILAVALIQSIIGILQFLKILPHFQSEIPAAGLFINPGILGGFLAIACCIIFYLFPAKINVKNFHSLLGAILILTALVLSESRTAWIATIVSVVIFSFIRNQYFIRRKKIFYIGVPSIILVFIFYLFSLNLTSAYGRLLIWKVGFAMFKENIIFGSGTNSFFIKYGSAQSNYFASNLSNIQEVMTASMNYYAFNEFLKVAVEGGIIGLLLWTFLLIAFWKVAIRQVCSKCELKAVIVPSIIVCILIFSCFSYPFEDPLISSIFVAAIALTANDESQQFKLSSIRIRRIHLLSAYLLLMVFTYISIRKLTAFYSWKSANDNILVQEGESYYKYKKLYPVLSNNGSFLFNYGSQLEAIGDKENALSILLRASKYGNSVELNTKIANLYLKIDNFKASEYYFKKAAYMNPKLFAPFYDLLEFYIFVGDKEKSKKIADLIITKPIKIQSNIIENIRQKASNHLKNEK